MITAAGELTEADYERFVTAFEHIAEEWSPVHVLVELEEFRGWAVAGLWEDLRFDVALQKDMGRVAIAGDQVWQQWGTLL